MKTTIELPDALIEQARRVAQQEGATLRALVEEGLQRSLEARRANLEAQRARVGRAALRARSLAYNE